MTDLDATADSAPAPRRRGGRVRLVLALIVLAALAFGGWKAWDWWQARSGDDDGPSEQELAALRLDGVEQSASRLRARQKSLEQRLQATSATNKVLREEILGMEQRAALLEEAIARYSDPRERGETALRLDEAELVLHQAQQRLVLAHDAEGALRAYALAEDLLGTVDEPAYMNLRQGLAQEIAALRALPPDPRAAAAGQLDALDALLAALPPDVGATGADPKSSSFDRLLSQFAQVRRSDERKLAPPERANAVTALQVEITLARAALERRDQAGFRQALARIDGWLTRLYGDHDALRTPRARLKTLAATPLTPELPTLGSTLAQLRALRASRGALTPAPPAVPPTPVDAR